MMDTAAVEAAADLRESLTEILRQLNRAEMEEPEGEGLELAELHHVLVRAGRRDLSERDVEQAVSVLVGNGYACRRTDAEYAWDRARTLGTRFTITTEGKSFLVERLRRTNRIE